MKKKKVAVLAGGWSREKEVSLESGKAVYQNLDRTKYDVDRYDPKYDFASLIRVKDETDIVFNLLHGKYGEDGCIQGALKINALPFVGSGVLSSAMAFNKKVSKEVFRRRGLKVPNDIVLCQGEAFAPAAIMRSLGKKIVIKPVAEGSSVGISVCNTKEKIKAGIKKAFKYDREIIIEEFIEGKEISACVIGNSQLEVLPLIEIIPSDKYLFFDYDAKYREGASQEICPAFIPEALAEKAHAMAKESHRALLCRVWSRTDMIIKGNDIYLLETNTLPGMTKASLFPLAAKVAGYSFTALLDRLITLAFTSQK